MSFIFILKYFYNIILNKFSIKFPDMFDRHSVPVIIDYYLLTLFHEAEICFCLSSVLVNHLVTSRRGHEPQIGNRWFTGPQ